MALRHIALAVLVAAIWGFNFVVIRVGLDTFPPLLLTALRFAVAALPALVVRPPALPARRMVLIGMTWFFGQFIFVFTAMTQGMPPGLASLTLQAQSFLTILIAALVLHERPSPRQMAGVAVALCGLGLIGLSVGGDMTLVGLGLTLCAAASWAVGNVLMRQNGPVDMLSMVVWLSLVPPVPAFALSLAFEGWPVIAGSFQHATLLSYGAVLYLAVPTTLLGFGIWGFLLKLYPAGTVAPFSLLVPLFGTLSAALVLGERFPPLRFAGMALIVCGLLVVALPLGKWLRRARAR
ncbi:EamA family transporter [Azorhizobium doebereinerae]|uniref:EamA family transporter n=1 Tax=Azorhizobium doebereinerae TaxID=281091 RepID=UPI00041D66C9|nr:EamA family transporter [Azorhizobium doebereinerae]